MEPRSAQEDSNSAYVGTLPYVITHFFAGTNGNVGTLCLFDDTLLFLWWRRTSMLHGPRPSQGLLDLKNQLANDVDHHGLSLATNYTGAMEAWPCQHVEHAKMTRAAWVGLFRDASKVRLSVPGRAGDPIFYVRHGGRNGDRGTPAEAAALLGTIFGPRLEVRRDL